MASRHVAASQISALVAVTAAIGIAAWSLLGDFDRDRASNVPAQPAGDVCPRDALPLGADAARRSRALVLADAHRWIRSRAALEVAGTPRIAGSGRPRECGARFGRRAVVVRLAAPAERATWEFVVYRAPEGYRIWSASARDAVRPDRVPRDSTGRPLR